MDAYGSLLRPLLFSLPAETAHNLARAALRHAFPWRLLGRGLAATDARLRTSLGGIPLSSPVGLAPGLDKNGELLRGLRHLGFGYLMVGSILPERRSGNPRPRVLRYPDRESLINCYGLPSQGLAACVANLRAAGPGSVPVIANIDAPTSELYLRSLEAVQPLVDGIELGLACPNNTDDDHAFHRPGPFEALVGEVVKRRRRPVFVKMLACESDQELQARLELVERGVRLGVDGFTLPGTWNQPEPRLSLGRGHVSGRIAFQKTLRTVRELHAASRGRCAIKALGGVSTGAEAFELLAAGATSVELLSAFVYQGWQVAARINRELLGLLEEHRVPSVALLRPAAA